MLADIARVKEIYIACGYTDMRKSINGLAANDIIKIMKKVDFTGLSPDQVEYVSSLEKTVENQQIRIEQT